MNSNRAVAVILLGIPFIGSPLIGSAWGASPRTLDTTESIDRLLAEEIPDRDLTALADDETYLRRVYLDLIGQVPTAEEVLAFGLDRAPDKRAKIVDTLLADADYGQNMARYWRDVIMYRKTEPRAAFAGESLVEYLQAAFNENVKWDAIVTEFITATGDVRERGETALIMAQGGKPEDVVSEVSRIFLGIQIQCAQCHDHPTDRWRREQFHELAAFFPRVAVRPKRDADKRTFLVTVNDDNPRRRRRNNNNRVSGKLEHFMPDLADPASRGKQIQPVFFLTGSKLPFGTRDAARRSSLAEWITDRENPWFAKAFVNRVWAELVGEGFCEPVDDLGPDRDSSAPQAHEFLANAFAHSNYDIKWLYRTILATQTYQSASRSRRGFDELPFEANCPQRLRGDQLYDALVAALGIPEPKPRTGRRGGYGAANGPRRAFNSAFGFDPSDPRGEVQGSIQQALAVMNGRLVSRAIQARRGGVLAAILETHRDDQNAITELYLQTLARTPSRNEIETSLHYVKRIKSQVGNRREPFEDLQWALVNSTEFLYRK